MKEIKYGKKKWLKYSVKKYSVKIIQQPEFEEKFRISGENCI